MTTTDGPVDEAPDPAGSRDGAEIREWWRWARMGASIGDRSPEAAAFAAFGERSYLAFPQGVLAGLNRIEIGADCVAQEHVTLSAGLPGERLGPGDPIIQLADRVRLGRRVEIVALASVRIGADVGIGPNCYLTDHNHVRHDPDQPISYQLPLDTRPIVIGAGCSLGAGVTVLAGAIIGEHTQIGAGTVVTAGTWPANSLIVGHPARIARRRQASENSARSTPARRPVHDGGARAAEYAAGMDPLQEHLHRLQRQVDDGALPLEDAARELAKASNGGLTLVGARDTLAHHRTISPPVPRGPDEVAAEATIAELERAARATAADERGFHSGAAQKLYDRYISETCDPYLRLPHTPDKARKRAEARGEILFNRAMYHKGLAS